MKQILYTCCFVFFSLNLFSQNENESLIQFSGSTLFKSTDSLEPVAFVLIKNKSRKSAAYSALDGFFSLVVKRGDTIEFSSVGFKKSVLIIPDNIQKDRFYATQLMIRDVNTLPEVVIVPWKNVDELKRAFIDLQISDDDMIVAYQNLQYEKLEKLRESLPIDAEESRRYNHSDQNLLLLQGTIPTNNLLSPLYKKKKKTNTDVNNKYGE